MEKHRPKLTTQPPSSRGTPNGASKFTTEGRQTVRSTEGSAGRDLWSHGCICYGWERAGSGSQGQGFQQQERTGCAVNWEELVHRIRENYANYAVKMATAKGIENKQAKNPWEMSQGIVGGISPLKPSQNLKLMVEPNPTAQRRIKESRGGPERGRHKRGHQAVQQDIAEEREKEKHLTGV